MSGPSRALVGATAAMCLMAPHPRATMPVSAQRAAADSMIVSTAWLAERLGGARLVVLHIGERAEYEKGHIPGAQFLSREEILAPSSAGRRYELPPVAQLEAALEEVGVSNDSRIVLYFGDDWTNTTARAYFTLDYLGLGDQSSILDGGLPAWRKAGQPVTTEVVEASRGSLTPRPRSELVVDAAWMEANLEAPRVAILDARTADFYSGARAGSYPRQGHIPGAANVPYRSVMHQDSLTFKSREVLGGLLTAAGVESGDVVITYCHTGIQATLLYFVARHLGYEVHLYDGSFEEWSAREDLPVVGPGRG
ncbi:MAG: hypothetical protein GTN78_22090 [Gemmatimonadales bacterium]|nr:hypothetical protein [Gemmatimonadales bacterium]NIN10849.1 hypothetical protein [Gemmatimonadales bacterium]NIR02857.1 hypothetical protein [Gemmatimonadales bacterium]NIS66491.1 hypothetical protein [Gemmatimonadales bacterium]